MKPLVSVLYMIRARFNMISNTYTFSSLYTTHHTAALDQLSEEHVQTALANIRKKKRVTTVTIAHRLTTIIDSDAIAVIANGKIAELGNHNTLLQKEGGIYQLLCESQGIKPPSESGTQASSSSTVPVAASITEESDKAEDAPLVNASIAASIAQSMKKIVTDEEQGLDDGADDNGDEEGEATQVEIATMSQIWDQVGWDSVYTILGVVGSGIVGALSPCESILTAKIVATFYVVEPDQMVEANLPYILNFLYFALASLVGNCLVGYGLSR